MDAEILSRIQFAITAGFHFLFPPISIGLGLYLVLVEAAWLRSGDEKFRRAAKFFTKLFAVLFAVGVATGIILEFEFGTNWPIYSNFVGDVFGSPLAIFTSFRG
ncbi:MAG: cytochrome ubiquinol oxidase subunit I [Opitutales bacterium]|nr:cytochrome ubiquinol oxidase subunit I [Opitutales bacterium]